MRARQFDSPRELESSFAEPVLRLGTLQNVISSGRVALCNKTGSRSRRWRQKQWPSEGHYFGRASAKRKSPVRSASPRAKAPHGARLPAAQAHARAADARRRAEPAQGPDARPEPSRAGVV